MAPPPLWDRNKELEAIVVDGLTEIDTHDLLVQMADHVSQDGVWATETISPSLVGSHCRLQRLHRYLGHPARFDSQRNLMMLREGKPDAITQLNFLRGFAFEGVIVSVLRGSTELRVVQSAPQFVPEFAWDGMKFAAHPDVLVDFAPDYGYDDDPTQELIQIKCPSWWGIDRLRQFPSNLKERYELQLQCEMLVCRMAGYDVEANNLLIGTWEGTPSSVKPSIICYRVPWDPEAANRVMMIAKEIRDDANRFKFFGQLPEAIPFKYNRPALFPCGYCKYARVGDPGNPAIPGCEHIGR